MKLRQMTLLLAAPLCCWSATSDVPIRDYRTVNFDNGITSRVIEVGTTSVTFSVEWTLDTDIPTDLMLIGKMDIEETVWDFLGQEEVVQTEGKAIVEHLYTRFPVLEPVATLYAQKAFFSLQMLVGSEEEWETTWGADGWATNGVVEPPINAPPPVAGVPEDKQGRVESSSPSHQGKSGIRNEKLETEEQQAKASPSHFWLYAGIALCVLCAIFYFLRRK